MRQPIYVNTPDQDLLSMVNFHSGNEAERKDALWSLMVEDDLNPDGTINFQTVSFSETKLSQLPQSLQEILNEDFKNEITEESWIVMRFFKKGEDGKYIPVVIGDPEAAQQEEQVK